MFITVRGYDQYSGGHSVLRRISSVLWGIPLVLVGKVFQYCGGFSALFRGTIIQFYGLIASTVGWGNGLEIPRSK